MENMATAAAKWSLVCVVLAGCGAPTHRVAQQHAGQAIATSCPDQAVAIPVQRDEALQTLIHRLVSGQLGGGNFARDIREWKARVRSPRSDPDDQVLLQAALYAAHAPKMTERDYEHDVPDPKRAVALVQQQLGIADSRAVTALAPYLMADDRQLRQYVFETVLRGGTPVNEGDLAGPTDAALAAYVADQVEQCPWAAAQTLYWKAPSAAVLELGRRLLSSQPEKQKALRDAVTAVAAVTGEPGSLSGGPVVVTDGASPRDAAVFTRPRASTPGAADAAVERLEQLSRFDQWWVRLYVAEMMRRYDREPRLRDTGIVRRLRNDANPLVAKAADVPFHHGMTAQERAWWAPFKVKEESEMKYLWRPATGR
jgi:hypothetical protein